MNHKSSESAGPRGSEDGALRLISVPTALVSVGIAAAKRLTKSLRGLVRDRRTKRWLRTQLPELDIFVSDLQKVVADRYVNSLAAVVDDLSRGLGRWEEMGSAIASLRVLREWVSCFSGQWEVAKQRLSITGAQHLLVELRFLLREILTIAKQCEANVPTSDGEANDVHGKPGPYTETRHKWKQFSAGYNRLVDDYQTINKQCARHLEGLSVFEFDRL